MRGRLPIYETSCSLISRDETITPRVLGRVKGCDCGGLLLRNLAIMEPGQGRYPVPSGHRGICSLVSKPGAGLMEIFHAPLAVR